MIAEDPSKWDGKDLSKWNKVDKSTGIGTIFPTTTTTIPTILNTPPKVNKSLPE